MESLDSAIAARTTPDPVLHEQKSAHEQRAMTEVVERLTGRFPDQPTERIRAVVDAAYLRFEGSPIRNYVPVFVERAAKDALR